MKIEIFNGSIRLEWDGTAVIIVNKKLIYFIMITLNGSELTELAKKGFVRVPANSYNFPFMSFIYSLGVV